MWSGGKHATTAEQMCRIQLRHSWSEPNDKTGPGSANPGTEVFLGVLGFASCGAWADAAIPVLWRTASEEVRPPTGEEFLAQVDRAVI